MTPSMTAWTEHDFQDRWRAVLQSEIDIEEADHGNTPGSYRVSGRKSKQWPNKEDAEFWASEGPKFAQNYQTWRLAHPEYELWTTPDGDPALELDFVTDFGDGVKVRTIIDRVYVYRPAEALAVVDLKSGRQMPDDIFQLSTYAAAIDLQWGVRPQLGFYWDARAGMPDGMESLAAYSTEMVSQAFRDFVKQRAAGVFLANPGAHCKWCDVRKSCPWSKGIR